MNEFNQNQKSWGQVYYNEHGGKHFLTIGNHKSPKYHSIQDLIIWIERAVYNTKKINKDLLKNIEEAIDWLDNKKARQLKLFEAKLLISEGGVAGHLNHLYDNHSLSFGDIKKIFRMAASGKLIGTEKTDGFNIFMTFAGGKAKVARNKGDIKIGGLDRYGLISRNWAGGETVRDIFVKAFDTFEKAISSLSDTDIYEIFGPNGNIYYNVEIMGPSAKNVISYDSHVLAIHRTGHAWYDKETGLPNPDIDVSESSKFLDKIINNLQNDEERKNFRIQRTAILKLKALSDQKPLKLAEIKLDILLNKHGLTEVNTILDYLSDVLWDLIDSQQPELSTNLKKYIIKVILGQASLKNKPKNITNRESSILSRFARSKPESKTLLKKAIWPLEEIIHDFTVSVLSGIDSAYILDNKKQLEDLRANVANAIQNIENYDGDKKNEVIDFLLIQLNKLKHFDKIDTNIEGFVFEYDGITYKFTGNFAPINQIMGIYKYGRGSIPPLSQDKEVENLNKTKALDEIENHIQQLPIDHHKMDYDEPINQESIGYAIIPGGFKPPHIGHWGLVKHIADLKNPQGQLLAKEVHILISPKSRAEHTADNRFEITAEMSKAMWDIYVGNDERFKVSISDDASPVRSTYKFVETMQSNSTLIVAKSEKDASDDRYKRLQQYADKVNHGIEIIAINAPVMSDNISGTRMREYISTGDQKSFENFLPDHLTTEEKNQCWKIVNSNSEESNMMEGMMIEIFGLKDRKPKNIKKRWVQSIDFTNDDRIVWLDQIENIHFQYDRKRQVLKTKDPDTGIMLWWSGPRGSRRWTTKPSWAAKMSVEEARNTIDNYRKLDLDVLSYSGPENFPLEEMSSMGAGSIAISSKTTSKRGKY